MTQEEYEYREFMAKLVDKVQDLNKEYHNLSPENKQRVDATVKDLLKTYGMAHLMAAICRLKF